MVSVAFLNARNLCSVKIDKNIQWRKDNQEAIVDFIKGQSGDDNNGDGNGDGSDASQLAASVALGATLLLFA